MKRIKRELANKLSDAQALAALAHPMSVLDAAYDLWQAQERHCQHLEMIGESKAVRDSARATADFFYHQYQQFKKEYENG